MDTRPSRESQSGPSRVSDLLWHVLDEAGGGDHLSARWRAVLLIGQHWKQMVGSAAAVKSRVVKATPDGTVVVEADTSAWMNELRCFESRILDEIRALPGCSHIRRIRFRSSGARWKTCDMTSHSAAEVGPAVERTTDRFKTVEVDKLLEPLSGDELKATLKRIFKRSLERSDQFQGQIERNAR